MARQAEESTTYKVRIHMNNGYRYASTQPLVVDPDRTSGRNKHRRIHWGTVDENNKFHPNKDDYSEAPLFYTVIHGRQQKMSPDTVAAFFAKYGSMAKAVCQEVPEHIHPHMMRHTRAMHLYQSGMPMVLLSQYLGHAQVETTMIYAYADTEMKRAAIQKADAVRGTKPVPDEIWADNEEMILKLSGLL